MNDDASLGLLRGSLVDGLRVTLGPEDGDAAFERHILLAVRFSRVAGLNQIADAECGRACWCHYLREHFPKRREWHHSDAELLWTDWRVGLVKWETPKARVMVAHGQPELHWRRVGGALCINLESMWDDFEASVDSFCRALRGDDQRREAVLQRWRARSWTVRRFELAPESRIYEFGVGNVSAALSATAIALPK